MIWKARYQEVKKQAHNEEEDILNGSLRKAIMMVKEQADAEDEMGL